MDDTDLDRPFCRRYPAQLVNNQAADGVIRLQALYPVGGGGDTYATTGNNKYLLMIRRINSVATYSWKALQ